MDSLSSLTALVAAACIAGCADSGLDRGTAEEQLSAFVSKNADPQIVDITVGESVPTRQGGTHTDAWWEEYVQITNGQDRTRMLYLEVDESGKPALVAGLGAGKLALAHGSIRAPERHGRTWWLYTPTTELRPSLRRESGAYVLTLCTQRDQFAEVIALSPEGPDRTKVDYAVDRVIDASPIVATLNGVPEAVGCATAPERQSRVSRFEKKGESWSLVGAGSKKRR
jgi:hypothetical protein